MNAEHISALGVTAAEAAKYAAAARAAVLVRVTADGKLDRALLDREQHLVHGLAWVATYAEALREVAAWARTLHAQGAFGEVERLLAHLVAAEYSAQLAGGVPMTQVEAIRPADFGVAAPMVTLTISQEEKTRLAEVLREARGRATLENTGLDADFELIRDQFRKFAEGEVVPHAHGWHMRDELIPIEIVEHMGALGVFGLTIPEQYGGSGLGKTAMCVVSEELSRGYIGVGSLGTRSEIAAELIMSGGTPEQQARWLPRIARAYVLPTAVFTEPNTGSDLGSIQTRARKVGGDYVVTGAKTWITHAARADLMTLLVRTDPNSTDHRGLSMLLAEKPRGTDSDPFPAPGMSGGEIEVLGYRGMKEYEIGFAGFHVPTTNLLGGEEGQGFKQLMATFESARIQT
ncbi:MAG: acyl-CoA dehydrogenase family protein, partial [Terricaulis sp.]